MSQVTKRALEASLKHLLLQKPLDKITIGDITEDCGINRMTFYYHFKDIYDLIEWSLLGGRQKGARGTDAPMTPGSRGFYRSLKWCWTTSRSSPMSTAPSAASRWSCTSIKPDL